MPPSRRPLGRDPTALPQAARPHPHETRPGGSLAAEQPGRRTNYLYVTDSTLQRHVCDPLEIMMITRAGVRAVACRSAGWAFSVCDGLVSGASTVGGVDEKLLAGARQAQQRLIQAEHDAELARAEFRRAVHRLVVRGSSPRDVAAALGLSDERVHEIARAADGTGRGGRGGRADAADIDLACSFCGRPQRKVRKLIASPGGYICEACVELAGGVVRSGSAAGTRLGQMHAVPEQDGRARCSFCGKRRGQIPGLAAMPVESGGEVPGPVAICAECLSLCDEIIAEELT